MQTLFKVSSDYKCYLCDLWIFHNEKVVRRGQGIYRHSNCLLVESEIDRHLKSIAKYEEIKDELTKPASWYAARPPKDMQTAVDWSVGRAIKRGWNFDIPVDDLKQHIFMHLYGLDWEDQPLKFLLICAFNILEDFRRSFSKQKDFYQLVEIVDSCTSENTWPDVVPSRIRELLRFYVLDKEALPSEDKLFLDDFFSTLSLLDLESLDRYTFGSISSTDNERIKLIVSKCKYLYINR